MVHLNPSVLNEVWIDESLTLLGGSRLLQADAIAAHSNLLWHIEWQCQ